MALPTDSNAHHYHHHPQPVSSYPLAAIIVALEDFFAGFDTGGQPNLSVDGLVWIDKV